MSDDRKPDGARFIRPKDLDNAARTTFGARLMWRIEAIVWDVLYWYPMKLLPIEWASGAMAAIVGAIGPLFSQQRTVMRNLRMCFPDWTDAQVKKVAKGAWRTMGHVVGEMFDDEGVGAQWHVAPVLLARTNGNNEPPIRREGLGDLVGAHLLDAARCGRWGLGVAHSHRHGEADASGDSSGGFRLDP